MAPLFFGAVLGLGSGALLTRLMGERGCWLPLVSLAVAFLAGGVVFHVVGVLQ